MLLEFQWHFLGRPVLHHRAHLDLHLLELVDQFVLPTVLLVDLTKVVSYLLLQGSVSLGRYGLKFAVNRHYGRFRILAFDDGY